MKKNIFIAGLLIFAVSVTATPLVHHHVKPVLGVPAWSASDNGITSSDIVSVETNGGSLLFAATAHQGVFVSNDNGGSWTQFSNGLPTLEIHKLLAFGTALYALTSNGVWETTPPSASWTQAGLANDDVTAGIIQDAILYVGTAKNGVYSKDVGYIPDCPSLGDANGVIHQVPALTAQPVISGYNWYSYTEPTDKYHLPYTVNFYYNIALTKTPLAQLNYLAMFFSGLTTIDTSLGDLNYRMCVYFGQMTSAGLPTGPQNITLNYFAPISTTWNALGLQGESIQSIAVTADAIIAGTYQRGIFKTIKAPLNWQQTYTSSTNITSMISSGATIYAGTDGQGVLQSVNDGTTFSPLIKTGLSNLSITSLLQDGSTLYAGTTGGGVYAYTGTWVQAGLDSNTITQLNVLAGNTVTPAFWAATMGGGLYKSSTGVKQK